MPGLFLIFYKAQRLMKKILARTGLKISDRKMFLIRPKPFSYSGVIICAALAIMSGAVNRNHFLRLYTVAASNSILFAAFIPLAFNLFMPVKFISVPHTGSTVLLRFLFITFAFTVCCLALALSSSAL